MNFNTQHTQNYQDKKSIPSPNKRNCQYHYISKSSLTFIGVKNNIWYYQPWHFDELLGFHLFVLNGSLKFFRKSQIEAGVFTFMNNSTQLIVQKLQQVQIWEPDEDDNWSLLDIIYTSDIVFDELKIQHYETFINSYCCHAINQSDDVLVITSSFIKSLVFLEKNQNDDWQGKQTLKTEHKIGKLMFNETGNLLAANSYLHTKYKFIVFCKDENDGQWNIIYEITTKYLTSFCFIKNQRIAYIELEKPDVQFLKVSSSTDVQSLPNLELYKSKQPFFGYTDISFIQSKNMLIVTKLGIFCIIQQNNKEYQIKLGFPLKNSPSQVYWYNQENLLLFIRHLRDTAYTKLQSKKQMWIIDKFKIKNLNILSDIIQIIIILLLFQLLKFINYIYK